MKKLLLTALVMLLAGCATPVPVPLNVQDTDRSTKMKVEDLRSASEQQREIFSLLVTSDAYAISRLDEKATEPPALRLLQHRAYEKLASTGAPLEMKVRHFVIYRNMQSELRRGAVGAGLGGIVGAAVAANTVSQPGSSISTLVDAATFQSLADSEYKRALYTEAENPGRGSLYVAYIETEMGGKRVFTRTMAPVKGKEGENALVSLLEAAVQFHLSQY